MDQIAVPNGRARHICSKVSRTGKWKMTSFANDVPWHECMYTLERALYIGVGTYGTPLYLFQSLSWPCTLEMIDLFMIRSHLSK